MNAQTMGPKTRARGTGPAALNDYPDGTPPLYSEGFATVDGYDYAYVIGADGDGVRLCLRFEDHQWWMYRAVDGGPTPAENAAVFDAVYRDLEKGVFPEGMAEVSDDTYRTLERANSSART